MKYAWIARQKGYTLKEMCNALEVSISGFRAWAHGGSATRKRLTDVQMLALIQAIHAELKGAYGSPRMVRELRARGFLRSPLFFVFQQVMLMFSYVAASC